MGHLKGIGLENFRVFNKMTYLNFAPLTILTGANNSGKSSVLKALMLIADNFHKLDFSGKNHNLVNPEHTKNKYSESNTIRIKLPLELPFIKETIFYEITYDTQLKKHNNSRKINIGKECLTEIRKNDKTGKEYMFFDFKLFFENITECSYEEFVDATLGGDKELEDNLSLLLKLKKEVLYHSETFNDIKIQQEADNIWTIISSKVFFDFYNDKYNLSLKIPDVFGFLNSFFNIKYNTFASALYYTHPEKQKRSYDIKDEDAINQILNRIFDLKEKHDDSDTKFSFAFIDKWTKEFGVETLRPRQNKTLNRNYIEINETDNIMDYGLGTTQIANILLAIQTASYKGWSKFARPTVLIEEPESNLHPNYQSKLADLLVDATINFNIQFIIETHSEYLIRKLQFLTAKNIISPQETVIHYFSDPKQLNEGEEQVKEIKIKKNGVLTHEFGTGFLDEADNLAIDLFQISDTAQN